MKTEEIKKAAILAAAGYDNPFDLPAYDKHFYDGFLDGVKWLFSLPLCDRLTDEEREQIQTMYRTSKDIIRMESDTSLMYSMHTQIMCVLECIFGKEMFDEKGGNNGL